MCPWEVPWVIRLSFGAASDYPRDLPRENFPDTPSDFPRFVPEAGVGADSSIRKPSAMADYGYF